MDTEQTVGLRTCPQCGYDSPHDALFCIECGESLISNTGPTTYLRGPECANCGNEELPGARFCRICGQALTAEAAVGQPWAAPVSSSSPQSRRSAVAARPQPIAPAVIPAAPVLASAPQAQPSRKSFSYAGVVALIGIALLLFAKVFSWPLLLLVLGMAYIVSQLEIGNTRHALNVLAILAAAALFYFQPRLLGVVGRGWPLFFFFFFFVKKKSGNRP